MIVYGKRGNEYYKMTLTHKEAKRLDNGAMVSCGITAPDCIDKWVKTGKASVVTKEQWNHSGCQSRCVLRGDDKCQW